MDIRLLYWINSHHNVVFDALFWTLSAAGELYFIWFCSALLSFSIDRKNRKSVFLGILISLFLVYASVEWIIKPVIARPRPFAALEGVRQLAFSPLGRVVRSDYSFPSGHCASSMAAACILGSFYRRLRIPLLLFVGLMGYSRIYLGMHYPTDCLTGFALGALCAILARYILRVTNPLPLFQHN
ncbi:MAG: phosphatase PAP2 family protein [Candidatus Aureabacteria bacterium]|nr:phosphatase PAP2 family protein [Candidatus Auribacterota bacterium]